MVSTSDQGKETPKDSVDADQPLTSASETSQHLNKPSAWGNQEQILRKRDQEIPAPNEIPKKNLSRRQESSKCGICHTEWANYIGHIDRTKCTKCSLCICDIARIFFLHLS